MRSNNSKKADKLVKQYLKLQREQDKLQEELDNIKETIAEFSKETRQKYLRSGKTLLKVHQYRKTIFPKINEPGRGEVEEIMRESSEWKKVITFDIIKLGTMYDKKKLSKDLIKKLKPYADKEKVIRITKSKVKIKVKS